MAGEEDGALFEGVWESLAMTCSGDFGANDNVGCFDEEAVTIVRLGFGAATGFVTAVDGFVAGAGAGIGALALTGLLTGFGGGAPPRPDD